VRLRRNKPQQSRLVALPERGEAVAITTSGGGHIPARVLECDGDTLLVAAVVPIKPFSAEDLEGMLLHFNNPNGRIRLRGDFVVENPQEPDVVRLREASEIEVLQEREYVRLRASRPVLVYRAGDQMEVPSYTVDLSGGGLLLAGPDNLKPDDEVQFRLMIQSGKPPVSGKGRVVRIDAQGRRAIEFADISELDRRRLVRFIFECQRSERQRGLTGKDANNG